MQKITFKTQEEKDEAIRKQKEVNSKDVNYVKHLADIENAEVTG